MISPGSPPLHHASHTGLMVNRGIYAIFAGVAPYCRAVVTSHCAFMTFVCALNVSNEHNLCQFTRRIDKPCLTGSSSPNVTSLYAMIYIRKMLDIHKR